MCIHDIMFGVCIQYIHHLQEYSCWPRCDISKICISGVYGALDQCYLHHLTATVTLGITTPYSYCHTEYYPMLQLLSRWVLTHLSATVTLGITSHYSYCHTGYIPSVTVAVSHLVHTGHRVYTLGILGTHPSLGITPPQRRQIPLGGSVRQSTLLKSHLICSNTF